MKRLMMFVLLVIALAVSLSQAQWISTTVPRTLYGAHLADTANAWIVGDGRLVYRTTDGGRTLAQQTVPPGDVSDFMGVYFDVNSQEGWVVGTNKAIVHTSNGGTVWEKQSVPTVGGNSYVDLYKIAPVGSALWIVGAYYDDFVSPHSYGGLILKSTNRGNTWTVTSYPQFVGLGSIVALDSNHVVVGGARGTIAVTTDNGTTWAKAANLDTNLQVDNIRFVNKLRGYAVTTDMRVTYGNAYLYTTTDGGFTWNIRYTWLADSWKPGLSVLGDSTVFVAGFTLQSGTYHGLFKSTDCGFTWNLEASFDIMPHNIYIPDSRHGMMVGSGGLYYYQYVLLNKAPKFTAQVTDTVAYVDSLYQTRLQASDADGDTLYYSISPSSSWLNSDSLTGKLSGTPRLADSGHSYLITAVVTDGRGGYDTTHFTIKVVKLAPPNQQPKFTCVIHDSVAYIDSLYSVNLTATDPDGDTLHYSLAQAPSFLRVDSLTGRIWGRPKAGDSGSHVVTAMVSDGRGGSDTLTFTLKVDRLTSVEQIENNVPTEFHLSQNYPNPFNPTTMISYQLPATSYVRLTVYDMLGREVAELVSGRQSAGTYRTSFNGTNLPSGTYLYRLQTGDNVATKKMVLMK